MVTRRIKALPRLTPLDSFSIAPKASMMLPRPITPLAMVFISSLPILLTAVTIRLIPMAIAIMPATFFPDTRFVNAAISSSSTSIAIRLLAILPTLSFDRFLIAITRRLTAIPSPMKPACFPLKSLPIILEKRASSARMRPTPMIPFKASAVFIALRSLIGITRSRIAADAFRTEPPSRSILLNEADTIRSSVARSVSKPIPFMILLLSIFART